MEMNHRSEKYCALGSLMPARALGHRRDVAADHAHAVAGLDLVDKVLLEEDLDRAGDAAGRLVLGLPGNPYLFLL